MSTVIRSETDRMKELNKRTCPKIVVGFGSVEQDRLDGQKDFRVFPGVGDGRLVLVLRHAHRHVVLVLVAEIVLDRQAEVVLALREPGRVRPRHGGVGKGGPVGAALELLPTKGDDSHVVLAGAAVLRGWGVLG